MAKPVRKTKNKAKAQQGYRWGPGANDVTPGFSDAQSRGARRVGTGKAGSGPRQRPTQNTTGQGMPQTPRRLGSPPSSGRTRNTTGQGMNEIPRRLGGNTPPSGGRVSTNPVPRQPRAGAGPAPRATGPAPSSPMQPPPGTRAAKPIKRVIRATSQRRY